MTSKELRKQRRREEHNARKEANRKGQSSSPVVTGKKLNAPQPSDAMPAQQSLLTVLPEPIPCTGSAWHNPDALPSNGAAYVKSERAQPPSKTSFDLRTARRLPPENAAEELGLPSPTPTVHTERNGPKRLPVANTASKSPMGQNRQNAQFSTGPKTPEGKTVASKNAIHHGLASNLFLILPWENADGFDILLDNLRAEHQPATQTEALLVEKMAQHFWLSQRALHLQEICFHRDAPLCAQPEDLALYLRYGTTHDRAFHKCLAELPKLRAAQRKAEAGSERAERSVLVARDKEILQQRQQAAETRKKELHEARMAVLTSKKCAYEQMREHKQSPVPVSAISSAAEQPFASLKNAEKPACASPQAA